MMSRLTRELRSYFYNRPKQILYLLLHKEYYMHRTYFADCDSNKSVFRVLCEQVWQVLIYGSINKFYFPYGFDVKTTSEQRMYVHYQIFRDRRHYLNLSSPHNCSCILRDKVMFNVFAKGIGLKTAKNLFYVTNGDIFEFDTNRHLTVDELLHIGEYNLFCKLVDGECGNGIFILQIAGGKAWIAGEEISKEELQKRFSIGRYIAQETIKQHEDMSRLHPVSINSIRLVTVRGLNDGRIYVLPSILRIGTKGNIVDNTSQGGIAVGFNNETGFLKEYGFYKPEFGLKVSCHPDTGVIFHKFRIPHIKKVIEDALYFHSMLPYIHSVGWDIAVGENGPIFIEGNDNWEINGPQICNGGLKKEFNKLFYN